jgi:hypothetical protein
LSTECNAVQMEFQGVGCRKVEASFDGGHLSSEGGALLLRETDSRFDVIARLSSCFTDHRDQDAVEHEVEELLRQRIFGLALGYEDLNDHDALRRDPLLALASGKKDIEGKKRRCPEDRGNPLASASSLNRLELTPEDANGDSRYKKIVYHGDRIDDLMVSLFLESFEETPEEIVLDFDATDIPVHGEQESRFFHGYYKNYCYLPLYVTCGDEVLVAKLRPSNIDASAGTVPVLKRLVKAIRARFPKARIILRGDSGFTRDAIMAWCEANDIYYVLGLAKNERLIKRIEKAMDTAKFRQCLTGVAAREFTDFSYRTLNSWSRTRHVIGKAEVLSKGTNPRFIVSNLPEDYATPQELYEKIYCARGDMENRIKEQQLDLFATRTSTHTMRANQLRLWFSAMAYTLMRRLRSAALPNTRMAKATCGTIRCNLLKIAAQIKVSVRRVVVHLPTVCPYQDLFLRTWHVLRSLPHPT